MINRIFKEGDKVNYRHKPDSPEVENGIIKEIRPDMYNYVWVVYNCNDDWDNYKDYTAAKTHRRNLKPGWVV